MSDYTPLAALAKSMSDLGTQFLCSHIEMADKIERELRGHGYSIAPLDPHKESIKNILDRERRLTSLESRLSALEKPHGVIVTGGAGSKFTVDDIRLEPGVTYTVTIGTDGVKPKPVEPVSRVGRFYRSTTETIWRCVIDNGSVAQVSCEAPSNDSVYKTGEAAHLPFNELTEVHKVTKTVDEWVPVE